ncbi:MAG: hypothetical protein J6Y89_07765 [Lachnospiraceae bacterium]|nr:hypothetical protein [Lachnospiraceae bacterium]
MSEIDTTSEYSYEGIWREPDGDEIKLVSRSVKAVYEEKRPLIRAAIFAAAFFTMIFFLIIIWGGINDQTEVWLAFMALPVVISVFYLVVTYPRLSFKLRNSENGRFLVTDTRVIAREQNEVRYRGGRNYSYNIKVNVVLSREGGENDYRTFIISASDYRRTSIGDPGILVRYDTELDGRPFLSVDHYLAG